MKILKLTIQNYRTTPGLSTITRKIKIPEEWSEVNPSIILKIIPLIVQDKKEKNQLFALMLVLGRENYSFIDVQNLEKLRKEIGWMWNTTFDFPPLTRFFHGPKYINKKVFGRNKRFKVPFQKQEYILPRKFLYNIKVSEQVMGFAYLALFLNTQQDIYLIHAIATYCRPPKQFDDLDPEHDSDEREPYNSDLAEERAEYLEDLDDSIKLYIFAFLMGCLETISDMPDYASLFPKKSTKEEENNDTKIEEGKEEVQVNPWIWKDYARAVAKVGTIGKTIEEVYKNYFHDLLAEASSLKLEYEEMEEQRRIQETKNM